MPDQTIQLTLDSNGKLQDPGTTKVHKGENVSWTQDANITSFKIKGRFLGHHHPFDSRPKHFHTNPYKLQVIKDNQNQDDYVWKYKIVYTTTGSAHRHRLDPKIAVKSNPLIPEQMTFAFPLMLAIVTLRTKRYFQKIKLQIERSARNYKPNFQK